MRDHETPQRVLIRGARVIDPAASIDATKDIAIEQGLIAAIGERLGEGHADRIIDAQGLIACPGLIDPHVHLREPGQTHKEDIASGTRAAASGGFTSVCCMPNTTPALDSPEMLAFIRAKADEAESCRVFPVAAATKGRNGERPCEITLCDDAGAVGFSDDGDVIADAGVMRAVLACVAPTGKAFMQHCQEPALTRGAVMHAGSVAITLGHKGWPREAEEIIIERDIRLNRAIGCRYHIQHMSSGASVELAARARRDGQPVTAEASPHHLLLTHDAIETHGSMAKMNPPLREQSDIEALKDGIREGVVTVLATDHAPHHADEKRQPLDAAPFGIIGLESALALYHQSLVEPGVIGWPRLIEMMTIEPARLCTLDTMGLGSLREGGPADLTLIDPDHAWVFDENEIEGKSANSPFLGRPLKARAVLAMVAGAVTLDRIATRV